MGQRLKRELSVISAVAPFVVPVTRGAVCSTTIALSGALKDPADAALRLSAASAVPQSPQKRLPGFSAPHFGQRLVNGAPQSPQNLLPLGLSLSHFEQRISSPVAYDDSHPIYQPAGSRPLVRTRPFRRGCCRVSALLTLAENGAPYAHDGGPLQDCNHEIVGHSHRQLG